MPPIDPNISLRTLVPQIQSPLDSLHKGLSLEALQAQTQLLQSHAAKYAQDANDEQSLAGAYVVDPTTGEVDVAKTRLALAARNPRLAMKFDQEQATHQETMLKRSTANEELQRRIANDKAKRIKDRGAALQDLNRKSLAAAYQAKWGAQEQGADDATATSAAQQAGHQVYMTGLQDLHQGGVLSANATVPAQFDMGKFEQAAYQDPGKWEQFASQQEDGDQAGSADMGGGSGGQFVPAVQTTGGPAAANAIQAAQAPGQPQAPAPVALPTAAPTQPPETAGGEMMPVAGAKKPALAPEYQIPPTAVPEFSGGGQDWMKTYAFNQQILGMKNPASSPVLVNPSNGKVIQNEPLLTYRERVAKAGRSLIATNTGTGSIDLTEGKGKVANDINEALFKGTQQLQGLRSIIDVYKPEFQTVQTQLGMKWSEIKDRFGQLDAESKKHLASYAAARRRAYESANQTIKFLSGTAVSGQEWERDKQQIPIPGTGVGDGDSPTEFMSKLEDVYRIQQLYQAKLMYLKKNGLPMDAEHMNLDDMPGIMKKRAADLSAAAKKANPGIKDADVIKIIKPQMAQEFGLQ